MTATSTIKTLTAAMNGGHTLSSHQAKELKTARFAKGSGCYTCKCCGRKTRSTGQGDNEHLLLCVTCYDLSGFENQLSDRGAESFSATELVTVSALLESLSGGATLFPELAALFPQEEPVSNFYLVTVTGPEFEPILLAVDSVKSSRARRAAKQELKAAGIDITGLTFNACKA